MSFIIQQGGSEGHRFINDSLVNPTAGWLAADADLVANYLVGQPYYSPGIIKIDGCTHTRTGAGSGSMTTAIYKYNPVSSLYEIVPNTQINTWDTTATGYQTIAITETTMTSGIYLLVILGSVSHYNTSGYTTQFPYTPLGYDGAGATYQAMTKTSYTWVADLPATLVDDTSLWTFSNSYYGKFPSFLLNQA
jgi:hypothetical protein